MNLKLKILTLLLISWQFYALFYIAVLYFNVPILPYARELLVFAVVSLVVFFIGKKHAGTTFGQFILAQVLFFISLVVVYVSGIYLLNLVFRVNV